MYQQASQASGQQAEAGGPGTESTAQAGPSPSEEDVVDADFEEVKDDRK
jgi:hypothetical protein